MKTRIVVATFLMVFLAGGVPAHAAESPPCVSVTPGALPVFTMAPGECAATDVRFTLPQGYAVAGHATESGGFTLSLVPLDTQAPNAASTGLEPTYECTNDYHVAPYGTDAPLTATFTGAVVPNVASLGGCTGAVGLMGPINTLYFSTSGDRGGGIQVSSFYYGTFYIFCGPVMTGVGSGVYDQWATTFKFSPSDCHMHGDGVPPSQYGEWSGYVYNSNQAYGSTRGLVTVS